MLNRMLKNLITLLLDFNECVYHIKTQIFFLKPSLNLSQNKKDSLIIRKSFYSLYIIPCLTKITIFVLLFVI